MWLAVVSGRFDVAVVAVGVARDRGLANVARALGMPRWVVSKAETAYRLGVGTLATERRIQANREAAYARRYPLGRRA